MLSKVILLGVMGFAIPVLAQDLESFSGKWRTPDNSRVWYVIVEGDSIEIDHGSNMCGLPTFKGKIKGFHIRGTSIQEWTCFHGKQFRLPMTGTVTENRIVIYYTSMDWDSGDINRPNYKPSDNTLIIDR
jgi:hypothetical protein